MPALARIHPLTPAPAPAVPVPVRAVPQRRRGMVLDHGGVDCAAGGSALRREPGQASSDPVSQMTSSNALIPSIAAGGSTWRMPASYAFGVNGRTRRTPLTPQSGAIGGCGGKRSIVWSGRCESRVLLSNITLGNISLTTLRCPP